MPWECVAVSEQRLRFLEDYRLNYHSGGELTNWRGVERDRGARMSGRAESNRVSGLRLGRVWSG